MATLVLLQYGCVPKQDVSGGGASAVEVDVEVEAIPTEGTVIVVVLKSLEEAGFIRHSPSLVPIHISPK